MIGFQRAWRPVVLLTGIAFGLGAPGTCGAALKLDGDFVGSPGQVLEVTLRAPAAQQNVFDLFINPFFPSFLQLEEFVLLGLPVEDPDDDCRADIGVCSLAPGDPFSIPQGDLVKWKLRIADSAQNGDSGPVNFGISFNGGDDLLNTELDAPDEFLVTQTIPEVPEPSAYLTLAVGLGALFGFLRRRATLRTV
jgi:hypothetical protein